ncbi:ThiF family adenylyltransferase [Mangrovactinospora gilvigrisea]|uniref:ThiF family adenylyltransferase n=1 Tax=Mangrovactinospora gilvigrisea TaxID=1428644 RepID=UPI001C31B9BD|nr:ThiF family adenylyltransferase [Mangrovactinospora gilvigrisea]
MAEGVRRLRARILFDHGRRPDFRTALGEFEDDQELDFGAWHFVARDGDGEALGYVRLCVPEVGEQFQTRAFLGAERYAALLREHGLDAADTYEHSRLVVEHRARKLGLGIHLNAAAIGAARHLGARAMVGTSGTADGQDVFHARFGFRPVDGTRRYAEQYTEDVVVMMYRAAERAGEHAALVEELERAFPGMVTSAGEAAASVRPAPRKAAGRPEGDARWRAELFDAARDEDARAVKELRGSGQVREELDTLGAQLEELVTCREPSLRGSRDGIERAVTEQLAGRPVEEYGTWAWYPWSGRLVHLLPREEFRLVRTDRNRGRIERPQQRDLLERRVGIIGLSVGSSAALTFAMEGIAGAYKLADFDELSVSNLNRLRAGVHHLGLNKCVIAARQMAEIDPWLDIEIYTEGLTDEVIREFFTGGHGPIDLLVEECDTPRIKMVARQWARELRIPVVMDANDRGLLDVERFDLEPERPLLHGLLGDATADELADPGPQELIEIILAMVGRSSISAEMAAAIPRIGTTLSSWPQLASGVALGGALTADAARRILLGLPRPSGRYYTDLDLLTSAERNVLT